MVEYLSGERIQGYSGTTYYHETSVNSGSGMGSGQTYYAYGSEIRSTFDGLGKKADKWTITINNNNAEGVVEAQLYSGVEGATSKTYVASSTNDLTVTGLSGTVAEYSFTFATPRTITTGDVYVLVFKTDTDTAGSKYVNVRLVNSNDQAVQPNVENLRNYFITPSNWDGSDNDGHSWSVDPSPYLSNYDLTSKLELVSEMDDITNVPSGTRFEDTATRKIYRRATIAGKALGFNGSSSYVYMNDTPDTNFTFGAGCTVSWNMWYKASSTGQSARLWAQNRGSGSTADQRGVTFGIVSGTGFNLFASTSNSDYYLNGTDTNVIPNDTNWHMLTVTYDEDGGSNNLKIYIDGSSVATRSGTTSGSASNPAYYPNIGRMVSATEYFAGLITEYSVWSRALSTSDITALWNSGDGKVTSDVSTTGLVAYYKMDESSGDILNYGSGSNWQAANSNITFSETGKVSSQEWKERGVAT